MKRFLILFLLISTSIFSQNEVAPSSELTPPPPTKIEIKPTARDFEIANRLEAILQATEWFKDPKVQVKEGVVFLYGEVKGEETKKWAGDLARSTRDVSAVVNKIQLEKPSIWNFDPIFIALQKQWRDIVNILPAFAFVFIVFALTWLFAKFVVYNAKKIFRKKIPSPLLQDVLARGVGFLVFLFGFYIIFRILGLTTIALTILGGTGALGIVLGIAFRDITENLLASIFLSIHHPFQTGDLIQIEGIQGYVQKLTIRSTVLISLDGNHIQIPNAFVYKNTIHNYSVNPNYQTTFSITIGFDESIPSAQKVALDVLSEHPAVLSDPEPSILVDSLENGNVTLKIYFWVDGTKNSWIKVKSSVIRQVKRSFQDANISLPGRTTEVIIHQEVPIHLTKNEPKEKPSKPKSQKPDPVATSAEGELTSEAEDIQQHVRQSRPSDKAEENLLDKKPTPKK